jgi:heme exporter protein D
MANFFAMGGYAAYVWPAYAASALVLGAAVVLSLRAYWKARRILRELEKEAGETGENET